MNLQDLPEEEQTAFLNWAEFMHGVGREAATANEELLVDWAVWKVETTHFCVAMRKLYKTHPDRIEAVDRFTADQIEDPVSLRVVCRLIEAEIHHLCGQDLSPMIEEHCGITLGSESTEELFSRLMAAANVFNQLEKVGP